VVRGSSAAVTTAVVAEAVTVTPCTQSCSSSPNDMSAVSCSDSRSSRAGYVASTLLLVVRAVMVKLAVVIAVMLPVAVVAVAVGIMLAAVSVQW
jgi:hypothetical protein